MAICFLVSFGLLLTFFSSNLCCVSCSCSVQMLRFFGIGFSSPTLATAMSDLIPAFTFILAILFRLLSLLSFCNICFLLKALKLKQISHHKFYSRAWWPKKLEISAMNSDECNQILKLITLGNCWYRMEKLDWKTNSTRAKSIGTFVSITGALIITLYKGQAIIHNDPSDKLSPKNLVSSKQFDWVVGAVLLAGHSLVLSLLFIVQVINENIEHPFGLYANKYNKCSKKMVLLSLFSICRHG